MFLSTIQPLVVWKEIETKGVYRADEAQIEMLHDFNHAYRWLVKEMEIKIGPRPQGVTWPVWLGTCIEIVKADWIYAEKKTGVMSLLSVLSVRYQTTKSSCRILMLGIVSSIGRRVFLSKSSTRHWIWSLSVRATK